MKPTASFSTLAGSGRLKTATRTPSLHAPYATYFRLDSFTAALSATDAVQPSFNRLSFFILFSFLLIARCTLEILFDFSDACNCL